MKTVRRLVGLAVVAVTLSLVPLRADALSCAAWVLHLWPNPGDDAPLNAELVVTEYSVDGTFARPPILVLRAVGGAKEVPTKVRRLGVGTSRHHVLSLREPLRPRTRYVVMATTSDGKETKVGEFGTGGGKDVTPPEWGGIDKATFDRSIPKGPWCSGGESEMALLSVHIPTDGDARLDAYRFAVWVAGKRGRIDYGKPPLTYVAAFPDGRRGMDRARIELGSAPCGCPTTSMEFPKGERAIRVGIRALDRAGNSSAPSEVVIKL